MVAFDNQENLGHYLALSIYICPVCRQSFSRNIVGKRTPNHGVNEKSMCEGSGTPLTLRRLVAKDVRVRIN